ncbi:hypothetical protein HDU92_001674 [Lobulomyces angularis]|nr:hypothetical protein HDU92_001674 [Lobulomyces angularis]
MVKAEMGISDYQNNFSYRSRTPSPVKNNFSYRSRTPSPVKNNFSYRSRTSSPVKNNSDQFPFRVLNFGSPTPSPNCNMYDINYLNYSRSTSPTRSFLLKTPERVNQKYEYLKKNSIMETSPTKFNTNVRSPQKSARTSPIKIAFGSKIPSPIRVKSPNKNRPKSFTKPKYFSREVKFEKAYVPSLLALQDHAKPKSFKDHPKRKQLKLIVERKFRDLAVNSIL